MNARLIDRTDLEQRIAAIAARQHGHIHRRLALAAGMTRRAIDHRVATGRWIEVQPLVYRIAGAPESWRGALWASLLAAGPSSVVSHKSAAALHRLVGFGEGAVKLTVPHGSHRRLNKPAVVHQARHPIDLPVEIAGMPVTSLADTFPDLATVARRRRIEQALDDAWSAGRVTPTAVGHSLARVAFRGRTGVAMLTAVLDERGPGKVPSASEAERLLHDIVAAAGLPPLARQVNLPGRGAVSGIVDGCWHEVKLIVEADSRRWHSRIADIRRDRDRDMEAATAGYVTLRPMYEVMAEDPTGVADTLRAVYLDRQ